MHCPHHLFIFLHFIPSHRSSAGLSSTSPINHSSLAPFSTHRCVQIRPAILQNHASPPFYSPDLTSSVTPHTAPPLEPHLTISTQVGFSLSLPTSNPAVSHAISGLVRRSREATTAQGWTIRDDNTGRRRRPVLRDSKVAVRETTESILVRNLCVGKGNKNCIKIYLTTVMQGWQTKIAICFALLWFTLQMCWMNVSEWLLLCKAETMMVGWGCREWKGCSTHSVAMVMKEKEVWRGC